jgi:hypothetical protein
LANVPGVSLCSIQQSHGSEQITDDSGNGVPVRDFGCLTKPSFANSAALIKALDLVITVDTAVAHLAGALIGDSTSVGLLFVPGLDGLGGVSNLTLRKSIFQLRYSGVRHFGQVEKPQLR